ncbi:hypothetical protein COP2_003148 [Malus domestica]
MSFLVGDVDRLHHNVLMLDRHLLVEFRSINDVTYPDVKVGCRLTVADISHALIHLPQPRTESLVEGVHHDTDTRILAGPGGTSFI